VLAEQGQVTITRHSMEPVRRRQRRLVQQGGNLFWWGEAPERPQPGDEAIGIRLRTDVPTFWTRRAVVQRNAAARRVL